LSRAEEHPLERADKEYVWHPFTQMADWLEETPLVIERGEGATLTDIHGNTYLDGVSSLWVNVHGHRHPEIDQAIRDQLDKVAHSTLLGLSSVPAVEFAEALVAAAPPGLTKVFYSDDGATAVEAALKMAYQYWQRREPGSRRTRFVSLRGAYHGDTLGAVSVGGIDMFHAAFRPLLFPTEQVPGPYCYRCELEKTYPECELACADALGPVLERMDGEVAAVIVEPLVQGAAGMVTAPLGHLRRVRELCDAHGTLLICDEVATGFGRTGTVFACEQEGVSPDILCLAKGITGGYMPLAATLVTEEVYGAFLGPYEAQKTFFHGHSYTGNPLGCAAGLASLGILQRPSTQAHLKALIERLRAGLEPIRNMPHVGEVRQRGLMVGIELVRDKETREPYPWEERIGIKTIEEARRRGVILRPLGHVIVLMPSVGMTLEQCGELLEVTAASIRVATEGGEAG
jgi:adenosylmethionine-8-amino-7-oxononanoate aminotransferase